MRPMKHSFLAATETMAKEKRNLIRYTTGDLQTLDVDTSIFESTEYDIQNPSVVTDGHGNILVLGEAVPEFLTRSIFGRWSTDNGDTWVSEDEITGWEFEDVYTKPKIDYYGKGKTAWGTLVPEGMASGDLHYIEFPDITDPTASSETADGWTAWHVEWTNEDNMDSADVACYSDEANKPSPEFFGVVAVTGDNHYGAPDYEEDNTMMFSYFTEGGRVQIIFFYDMFADCNNMSTDIDQSNGQLYLVVDYVNETDPSDQGTWVLTNRIINDPDWWSVNWPGVLFYDLSHPQVAASDGRVYVVGEWKNETTGQVDIVCKTTTTPDDWQSWESYMVTDNTEVETYPSVSIVAGEVICSYIVNGDIYTSTSSDNGKTWEKIGKVNDEPGSVVEQYSGMNLGNEFIVWTDDRSGMNAVYFDKALSVSKPIIEITSISGGLGVSAVIENTGTADATDVAWSIDITGGLVILGGHTEGVISSLGAGESVTVKSGFPLGFGSVDITVSADGATESKTGKLLLFFITGL